MKGKPGSHPGRRDMASGQTQGRATPVRQTQTGRAAFPIGPRPSTLRAGPEASARSSKGPRGSERLPPPGASGQRTARAGEREPRRRASARRAPTSGPDSEQNPSLCRTYLCAECRAPEQYFFKNLLLERA